MARTDWQTINGSTNNNNYFFTGISWRYRDDLFGTSGYPASRIASNTDIIEYKPFVGRKVSSAVSNYYGSWLTSYYKYSYNTTSGSDPAAASNQLNVSTTYRFDRATVNQTYYLTQGEKSTGNPMNTSSSTTSRIIQVPHCSDGTSKLRLYFYFAGNTNTGFHYAETNGIVTLENIPRYTTINSFTVSKRNETSLTFNWSTADIVDKIEYSTNWGTNWKDAGISEGKSGSFVVSTNSSNDNALIPNSTYNCMIRVRRKDSQLTTDSSKVSQTTYAAPTQSLKSKTETTITMNWSIDSAANYIWYSTDGGTTWAAVGSTTATSGTYTISKLSSNTSTNLSANITYNIKTRVRRNSSNTYYDISSLSVTTYNYPYVSAVSSTNLTIGNSQTLTLYNPLGRNCSVYMKKDNTSGTTLYSGSTSNTTITFTPTASTLYNSITNATYGNCVYYCTYSSQTISSRSGTYIVSEAINKPTLSSSSFVDTNNTTIGLTGSSSKIVLNASTLQISVTIAGKNYATISTIKIEGSSRTVTAGGSGANRTGSATYTLPSSPTKSSFSVEATDSRGLTYSGTITIASGNVINYIPLTIVGVGKRNQPTNGKIDISSSGKYFKGSFGSISNTLTTTYRWKEDGGSYSSDIPLSNTTATGTHTEAQITLSDFDYTKNYYFQFKAVDKLNTETSTVLVTKGQPIFNWNEDEFDINVKAKILGYTNSLTVEGIKSKNLIGGWYSGSIDTSTGADISSSVAFRTDYIPVDFVNNSNYRMSGAPSSTYNNFVAAYTSNKTYIARTGGSTSTTRNLTPSTFDTTASNIKYLRMTVLNSVPESSLSNIQLEAGSTATTLVPSLFYGAISGTNGNGGYIKLEDGGLICYKRTTVTATINVAWGVFYQSTEKIDFGSLPYRYATAPAVMAICTSGRACFIQSMEETTTTSWGKAYLDRPSANNTAASYNIGLIAVGRWKA